MKKDLNEMKVLVATQEAHLGHLTELVELIKDDLKLHMKRSDTLENLYDLVKEEVAKLREEHNLTKQLLLSKIEAEQVKADNKSETLWTVLRTVFYTLSACGAVLLALKQLEILDKLFK